MSISIGKQCTHPVAGQCYLIIMNMLGVAHVVKPVFTDDIYIAVYHTFHSTFLRPYYISILLVLQSCMKSGKGR